LGCGITVGLLIVDKLLGFSEEKVSDKIFEFLLKDLIIKFLL
jgi:hypothetical protein